jgi:ubiquinone/menaquinone biosynthesis C-methylase UbiE
MNGVLMNIGRFAKFYRWCEYAAFGRTLERSRFAYLDRLSRARRVLLLGEGDGRALARLLAVAPQARIDVVELSGRMIELARRRVAASPRVHFTQQDALTMSWPDHHYDAVVTFFFLDCFSEPEAGKLIHSLAPSLIQNGLWLLSEFAIPESGWRKWHAAIWLWTMYRFFALLTGLRTRQLPAIPNLLREAGLDQLESKDERWGLIKSEVWGKKTSN